MPPRNWLLRITDILDAIAAIQAYTVGMEFTTFLNERKTIDAVIRNITIIGEAANHIPEMVVNAHPEIPWADMRDMRNVVVHNYFGVNVKIVWDTTQADLPPLVEALTKLLQEHQT